MNTNWIVNTGTNAVIYTGRHWVDVQSESGAFMLGMGLVMSVWVIGWCLRQTKWIGHFGGE